MLADSAIQAIDDAPPMNRGLVGSAVQTNPASVWAHRHGGEHAPLDRGFPYLAAVTAESVNTPIGIADQYFLPLSIRFVHLFLIYLIVCQKQDNQQVFLPGSLYC